jgi:hypothetical protein
MRRNENGWTVQRHMEILDGFIESENLFHGSFIAQRLNLMEKNNNQRKTKENMAFLRFI